MLSHPAPSPASFGYDVGSDSISSFIHAIPFVQGPARQPRALLARGQGSLPPVSTWPHGLEAIPDTPSLSGRPQLPAPGPQSLGYFGDSSKPWVARKASIDLVAETAAPVNAIQRLLDSLQDEEDLPPVDDRNRKSPHLLDPWSTEDVPIVSVPPLPLRGPIINATMPRGAFP